MSNNNDDDDALILSPCSLSSLELSQLGSQDALDPCILYDKGPSKSDNNRTTIVTIVQVTPSNCASHRDGAPTAINLLNQDRGMPIGFRQDYFVQFRLVSAVAGNPSNLSQRDDYERQHVRVLEQLIRTWNPIYIIGTCSFIADIEPPVAQRFDTILMAQVGPPAFYESNNNNSNNTRANRNLFGMHVNSDTYSYSSLRAIRFAIPNVATHPIRFIYRTSSEFFRSTCESAITFARENGFQNIDIYNYDPDQDSNQNGIPDRDDEEFLRGLARQACLSDDSMYTAVPTANNSSFVFENFHPSLFVCSLTEQDVILETWREMGCRPTSLWMTPSTWPWAYQNMPTVPYFFGGGQWHPAFGYSDEYFISGSQFLQNQSTTLGYQGSYDMVVSYSIPRVFGHHIQERYRIEDDPNLTNDLNRPGGREQFRRDLVVLKADTLFGPFALNAAQRNIGRESAGSQWLPPSSMNAGQETSSASDLRNQCISPLSQAEASPVVPAPASLSCLEGSFVSLIDIQNETSLLISKCNACPVDSITTSINDASSCLPCPLDATTLGQVGSTSCTLYQDVVLSRQMVAVSLVLVCVIWSLVAATLAWLCRRLDHPVMIRDNRSTHLFMICFGAVISSLSIVFVSFNAGSHASANSAFATKGCQLAPWVYSIGWIFQLGSIAAFMYVAPSRQEQDEEERELESEAQPVQGPNSLGTTNETTLEEQTLWRASFWLPLLPFLFALAADIFILGIWTGLAPLEFVRRTESTDVDLDLAVTTVRTLGRCAANQEADLSVWVFVGPMIIVHLFLLSSIFVLYYKHNRNNTNAKETDQNNHHKRRNALYAALVSTQVLVTGVPLLVAVDSSPVVRYLVIFAMVFINDLAVLAITFLPLWRVPHLHHHHHHHRHHHHHHHHHDTDFSSRVLSEQQERSLSLRHRKSLGMRQGVVDTVETHHIVGGLMLPDAGDVRKMMTQEEGQMVPTTSSSEEGERSFGREEGVLAINTYEMDDSKASRSIRDFDLVSAEITEMN